MTPPRAVVTEESRITMAAAFWECARCPLSMILFFAHFRHYWDKDSGQWGQQLRNLLGTPAQAGLAGDH